MTDIVERLRTKHILGVFEIERLRQEAADEIERLRSKTSMADGMLALSGLNVDIHATDIAVMKSTMAKLIAAEKEIERLRNAAQGAQEPTAAQVRSACLSYRHDFGLLTVAEAAHVKSVAREWLRAWQKEGFGSDRDEIIERCAQVVDQANREGPYEAIASAKRIRALKSFSALSSAHRKESSNG